ncbi:hypothetical protein [Salisediminibacterium selenitireducens]|uniref:Prenyltransferase/squalene oxidase n=1 Tax=Bacillus selenitireducens (strain ATCC 700615 / DSM 15326 / MLS10) TaxID=439292 RepID=D6XWG2_BACIE|nr:hypothetical protein [Salisediminibacterium selenitireducens]ADH97804.1 hypothetical protein Bsel_0262 [[Bacillus] selenitireducens MLS10]
MTGKRIHLDQAKRWLVRNGRPLEVMRFRYWFEEGSTEDVMDVLTGYQNEDGGFGHGIEPDFTCPMSSAIGSWTAARMLFELKTPAAHPVIRKLMDYLIATQNRATGMWQTTFPEISHFPHAPWWSWHEQAQEEWQFNPGVELAAYCLYYGGGDEAATEAGLLTMRKALKRLMTVNDMDHHELSNFQYALHILQDQFDAVEADTGFSLRRCEDQLHSLLYQAVETDPLKWGRGYQALPLDVVHSWKDVRNIGFEDGLVEKQIQYWKTTRERDGAWPISWEWGQYPEAFAIAKRQWQGILIVERFKKLKQLGMIQEET